MDRYFDSYFEKQEKTNDRYTDLINLEKSIGNNMELMAHQERAIHALDQYFRLQDANEGEKSGMLVMPTGSGKTFTSVKWLLNTGVANGYRIIWLVHRQELISQTYKTFREQAPCLTQYGIKKIRIIPVSGANASIVYARRGDINIVSINSIANSISKEMNQRFEKDDDMENWLKVKFDQTPLIREIYKNFYVFKRMVFDVQKGKDDVLIEVDTVREKLKIDISQYNLDAMLDTLIATYSFMNRSKLKSIRWSHRINKTWFGLCRRFYNDDGTYECDILINPVLAASVSNAEIINYTIYHEMIHAMGIWPHSENFRTWEWAYPNSAELSEKTNELLTYFDFDKNSFALKQAPLKGAIENDKQNDQINADEPGKIDSSTCIKQTNQKIICSFCSAELPPNSLFCNMCGTRVQEH